MTNDEFMTRFKNAGRDPIVLACSAVMWLGGVLFFGRVELWIWNRAVALQNRRYAHLVPLDRG